MKKSPLMWVGVLVVAAIVAALIINPGVVPGLSQVDNCERVLFDLDGEKFSSLAELEGALGLSSDDFNTFVKTFDVREESGTLTACPLEPEAFN